jgi:hypothetical protein
MSSMDSSVLNPTVPALAEEITFPWGSVMLTSVLLNVE